MFVNLREYVGVRVHTHGYRGLRLWLEQAIPSKKGKWGREGEIIARTFALK